jgi:hypothetical protein
VRHLTALILILHKNLPAFLNGYFLIRLPLDEAKVTLAQHAGNERKINGVFVLQGVASSLHKYPRQLASDGKARGGENETQPAQYPAADLRSLGN